MFGVTKLVCIKIVITQPDPVSQLGGSSHLVSSWTATPFRPWHELHFFVRFCLCGVGGWDFLPFTSASGHTGTMLLAVTRAVVLGWGGVGCKSIP